MSTVDFRIIAFVLYSFALLSVWELYCALSKGAVYVIEYAPHRIRLAKRTEHPVAFWVMVVVSFAYLVVIVNMSVRWLA